LKNTIAMSIVTGAARVCFASPGFAQDYRMVIKTSPVTDPETMSDSIAKAGASGPCWSTGDASYTIEPNRIGFSQC